MSRSLLQIVGAAGCMLCVIIGALPVRAASPGAPPVVSPSAAPPVTLAPTPFDFAPTPLPLPGSHATRERQLAALLQGFEAVQQAQTLFSGQAGQDLALQVVITCRPGRRLDATALQSLVRLVCAAVPGLAPERVNVAGSDGRLLIGAGQVLGGAQVPARQHGGGVVLLLLLAVIALTWALWRFRKPAPAEEGTLEALLARRPREVARLLAQERPEVAGAIVAAVEPRLAKRLLQALKTTPVAVQLPPRAPDPAAVAVIAAMLSERT